MTTVVLNTVTRAVEVFSSARDVQARAEIADHMAAANPHPQYLAGADLADVALSGDAGDLASGTVPDARMPSWTGYNLASRTALEAANIPAAVVGLRLLGHSAAGDGGGAHYKRAASEPAHAGKMQSNDGAWWEIATTILAPEMFGIDGVDDGPALQNAASVSKVLKRPVVGRGEYLLDSAVDFTGAVIDFSAAKIKLADNFVPAVAITLGQPEGVVSTTLGRYSANLFIDGNKANQSGTPIAVVIEDLITPNMRFVIQGADCNTLVKVQGAAEYFQLDIHASRCELACLFAIKTVAPLSDASPGTADINLYGHSCDSYFKADGSGHMTAKVNLFTEQGGGNVGDRAVNLVSTQGEFILSGIVRAFVSDVSVYANMTDAVSHVAFDQLHIDTAGGTHGVHVENVGMLSGFLTVRASKQVRIDNVTGMLNLSIATSQAQSSTAVGIGKSGSGTVRCGILNLTSTAPSPGSRPLVVDGIDNGATDMLGNTRGLVLTIQTDGSEDTPVRLNQTLGLSLHQANCNIEWRTSSVVFSALEKTTSGMRASIEIADDAFVAFEPPHRAGRILVREPANLSYFEGMYRASGTPVMTEFHSTPDYDGTTGALTGTAGTDGNVTVSAHSDNKLYIENRRGTPVRFWIVLD